MLRPRNVQYAPKTPLIKGVNPSLYGYEVMYAVVLLRTRMLVVIVVMVVVVVVVVVDSCRHNDVVCRYAGDGR